MMVSVIIFISFISRIINKKIKYYEFSNDDKYTMFEFPFETTMKIIYNLLCSLPNLYLIHILEEIRHEAEERGNEDYHKGDLIDAAIRIL